jgi:hypothetical protein
MVEKSAGRKGSETDISRGNRNTHKHM